MVLPGDLLAPRVEFASSVDVLAALRAPHVAGRHRADVERANGRTTHFRQQSRVEIGRVVFLEKNKIKGLYIIKEE